MRPTKGNQDLELWHRLKTISKLSFTACSADGCHGWNGTGNGLVTTQFQNDATIIYLESGYWTNDSGIEIKFSNRYRWSKNKHRDSISLEHLRYGEQNAVALVELSLNSDQTWKSETPHICNLDSYTAEIRLNDDAIQVEWFIIGPHKDNIVRYQYC